MERGTVVQWLKSVGEAVKQGEPVVLIDSEKVAYEVEALGSGKLRQILAEAGTECPPGHLLGVIAQEGEDVEAFLQSYAPAVASEETTETSVTGAPETPTSTPAPVQAPEVKASPRARKLAAERRVDLAQVAGLHPGKRITEEDVIRFLEQQAGSPVAGPRLLKRVPLAGMRREIASRMLSSWQSAPMVAVAMPVDFLKAEHLRQRSPGISHQDVILRAVALELRRNPALNSALRDGNLEVYDSVHIGFAVSLEDGLIVPVIRDADRKSIPQISAERTALAEAARSGRLKLEQVQGGTFTVSSLGAYGVTVFTPILNPPQVGILGIGAVEQVAAKIATDIEFRPRLTLTLVFDHRAVDGASAASFLRGIRDRLERSELD